MQIGDIVTGEIRTINSSHLIIELSGGTTGLLHISEVSDYYVSSLENMFQIGELRNFLVVDTANGVKLSWKKIVPRYLKNPFKFTVTETESGFTNLYNTTLKGVEND